MQGVDAVANIGRDFWNLLMRTSHADAGILNAHWRRDSFGDPERIKRVLTQPPESDGGGAEAVDRGFAAR